MSYRGKRVEFQVGNGESIYVAKSVIDGIFKKATVSKLYPADGKMIIEYKGKKGDGSGVIELHDIGRPRT